MVSRGEKDTDNGNVNDSRVANAGGNWNNGSNAGAFHLNVNNSTSNSNSNIGAHLMSKTIPYILDSIMRAKVSKGQMPRY